MEVFRLMHPAEGLAPEDMDIPFLLDYLLSTKVSELTLNFIKVHIAAISALHSPVKGHSVFTHPLTTIFWKGLLQTYSPIQTITPPLQSQLCPLGIDDIAL